MKSRLLILFLSLSLTLVLSAKERDCLLLHFTDGSRAVFLLEDNPKVMFEDGLVYIGTEHYRFGNIRKYTLADSENIGSGIEIVESAGKNVRIENGVLYLTQGKAESDVRIYSADGKEMPLTSVNKDGGVLTVDLSAYGSGVYMLQVGSETIKIIVR